MASETATATSRLHRRKARTRAALVRAAQALLADGRVNIPVAEITQAADVGLGSFYNHFQSKEQLFRVAPDDCFSQSFRLTARLHRRQPELSRALLHEGLALVNSDRGLAPRALRDIK